MIQKAGLLRYRRLYTALFGVVISIWPLTNLVEAEGVKSQPIQEKPVVGVLLADSILKRWPDPDGITAKQWEYTNGIVLYGIEKIYEKTGNPQYLNYVRQFADHYINSDGRIPNLRSGHNLDVIQPFNLLFTLYRETREPRYLQAMERMVARFPDFPKNNEGGFWHKANYPNQMWLDGIYMAEPFLARFGAEYGNDGPDCTGRQFCFNTATFQILLAAKHTLVVQTGLARHAWDASGKASWAGRPSGVAPECWSRAMGWYAMALVDTLEYLPKNHPEYQSLTRILGKIAVGVKAAQDPRSGLWYQVMNKGNASDNWTETSGSAMLVYALKKAVNLGLIGARFRETARRGWEGVKSQISLTADGIPVVRGSVEAMGVQGNYRDYVSKSRVNDLPHGMAAVLMAASVMEFE